MHRSSEPDRKDDDQPHPDGSGTTGAAEVEDSGETGAEAGEQR